MVMGNMEDADHFFVHSPQEPEQYLPSYTFTKITSSLKIRKLLLHQSSVTELVMEMVQILVLIMILFQNYKVKRKGL